MSSCVRRLAFCLVEAVWPLRDVKKGGPNYFFHARLAISHHQLTGIPPDHQPRMHGDFGCNNACSVRLAVVNVRVCVQNPIQKILVGSKVEVCPFKSVSRKKPDSARNQMLPYFVSRILLCEIRPEANV